MSAALVVPAVPVAAVRDPRAPAAGPPGIPALSARAWSRPGYVALAVVAVLAVAVPSATETLRWVPFLLGLVLFSLPHGAVDHHVPSRFGRRGGTRFVAVYSVAVLVGLALWAIAPVATLVAFLAVAAAHWGCGDAWYARTVHGRGAFGGRIDAVLFVAARGALPVALPALAHPTELARGADAILAAVGAGAAPVLSPGVRAAGLAAVGLLVLAALASGLRQPAGPARRRDALELVGLTAFFLLVPAVLAVGTYLLAWHAPRHVARLVASEPTQARATPGRALWAFTREAAPLTLVSLAGLVALGATAWSVPAAQDAVAGGALALIAALTFPHAALVAWMDREQRVYSA